MLANIIVIAMEQEMDFIARMCQLTTIIAANGARSYNRISHFLCINLDFKAQSYEKTREEPKYEETFMTFSDKMAPSTQI